MAVGKAAIEAAEDLGNMRVLTLNCGSSSVKYAVFRAGDFSALCRGIVERIGLAGSFLREKRGTEEIRLEQDCLDHRRAVGLVLDVLGRGEPPLVGKGAQLAGVGHRVVHGGERFTRSTPVTDELIAEVERLAQLAPLHNPPNLAGIRAARDLLPGVPQVAVFDTAFHQTLSPEAFRYPLPAGWYEKYGVRRYGFHGTSHLYVAHRAAALMRRPLEDLRLVTLHIGNGASATAIVGGRSVDTSMGFTPLEGLVMGTRCGSIDPAIPLWLMQKEEISAAEMDELLNKKSGILGLTGRFSDRREVLAEAAAGDEACRLAMKIETRAVAKIIGAYAAVMGGLDGIVFTAGVGENAPQLRALCLQGLGFLGVELKDELNLLAVGGKEMCISTPACSVQVWVVPTDEERVIAEDTLALVQGRFERDDFRYSFSA